MAALILGTAHVRGNRVLISEASSMVFTISCKIIWFSRPINVQYKFVIHVLKRDFLNNCNIYFKLNRENIFSHQQLYFTYRS